MAVTLTDAGVGRRADSDVVCVDPQHIQQFLHGDTDRCATTPHADDVIGTIATLVDLPGQLEGIFQQLLGADVVLVHRFFVPVDRRGYRL